MKKLTIFLIILCTFSLLVSADERSDLQAMTIMYMDFEEGSGTTVNSSEGTNYVGTLNGGTIRFGDGKLGDYSINMTRASNDHVEIDDQDNTDWSPSSQSIFFWYNTFAQADFHSFIAKTNPSSPDRSGYFIHGFDGADPTQMTVFLRAFSSQDEMPRTSPETDYFKNTWNFMLLCINPVDQQFMVNDVKVSNFTFAARANTTGQNMWLGSNNGGSTQNLDGAMDGLGVVNQYICNDSTLTDWLWNGGAGNQVFQAAGPPTVPVFTFPVSNPDSANTNITFNWSSTDPQGDPINYSLYINLTGSNMELVYTGNDSNFTSSFASDGDYKYVASAKDSGGLESANSSERIIIIDTVNPLITITAPTNATTFFPSGQNITFDAVATDANIFRFNITFYNSSNDVLFSQLNSTPVIDELGLRGIIDISMLNTGTYFINFTASDSHTFGDLRNLTYGYSDGTISFFKGKSPNKKLDLDLGYYSNGEVQKIDSNLINNFNIVPFIKNIDNEYKFGMVFDLPATSFYFGWRQNKIDDLFLYSSENAHYIWDNEFYVDYDASICRYNAGVLTDCRDGSPSVISSDNYDYIYYNYDLRNWYTPGDRLVFYTKSIGGLNIVTEQQTVFIDGCGYMGGNWVINEICTFESQTIAIDGNLTIGSSGQLNITNVTLDFNTTEQWLIFTDATSKDALTMFGTSRIN